MIYILGGSDSDEHMFIANLEKVYVLGTITHLTGSCLFYGLHVSQNKDFQIQVHCDDKLGAIKLLF